MGVKFVAQRDILSDTPLEDATHFSDCITTADETGEGDKVAWSG